jgi:hypothetical protein
MMKIYSQEGVLKATVSPDDSSTGSKGIMEDNVLPLVFKHFDCILIDVNDYVDFLGERFWALERYAPDQKSTVEWEYNLKLYGLESLIKRILVLKLTDDENEPVFSLTAPAVEHVRLFVDNINRAMGTTDWKVGEVIETPNLTVDYSGTFINKGLDEVAELAETEWWIDGETVNLTRCEHGEPVTLGYRNGLMSISRDTNENAPFFTRLFPIGSSRNIDPATYGHSRLQLPSGEKYVEQNAEYGVIEHFEETAFQEIYPKRTGTVGTVRHTQQTGENGEPFTIYYFTDPDLDFDPNDYELPGLVKNIVFQSGELNGRDFEVNCDSSTKEFEIITQFPYDDDTQLPGGALIPKSGDEYILYNIRMPDEYHSIAEEEFAGAVQEYMKKNKLDKSIYKASTDYIDLGNRNVALTLGQSVRLESAEFFPATGYRMSRITRITRKVNNPLQADIEISDRVDRGKMAALEGSIDQTNHYIKTATAAFPDLIRSWESTKPADTNVYSARKTEREFLHKNRPDTAAGLIKFLQGAEFGQFIPGIETGSGGAIDREGNAELQSLVIRSFLKVPQLIYNKVSVTGGEMWNTEGAVIGSVTADGENAYILELDIEDGDHIGLQVDDICKGHYNHSGGFVTSYFRITHVNDAANTVRIVLGADSEVPGDINHPPVTFMNIARYGSFTVRDRQRSQYFSSAEGYIVLLDGVDNYKIQPRHYKAAFGNIPPSLLPDNLPIDSNDAGIYLKNVVAENFFQIDAQGNPVKIIRDRGLWSDDPEEEYLCNAQYQDEVWCDSCKYRCINEGTTLRPAYNSTGWLLVAGDTELTLAIHSTAGETFLWGQMDTTLFAVVKRGVTNITAAILAADWKWTRDSGDVISDAVWNNAHSGNTSSVHITDEDMNGASGTFTCEAYVRDGDQVLTETIQF